MCICLLFKRKIFHWGSARFTHIRYCWNNCDLQEKNVFYCSHFGIDMGVSSASKLNEMCKHCITSLQKVVTIALYCYCCPKMVTHLNHRRNDRSRSSDNLLVYLWVLVQKSYCYNSRCCSRENNSYQLINTKIASGSNSVDWKWSYQLINLLLY